MLGKPTSQNPENHCHNPSTTPSSAVVYFKFEKFWVAKLGNWRIETFGDWLQLSSRVKTAREMAKSGPSCLIKEFNQESDSGGTGVDFHGSKPCTETLLSFESDR